MLFLKDKDSVIYDWYQKATFSGRFLNFYSQYPISKKIDIMLGLVDRVLLLLHPFFHLNQNFMKKILIKS